MTDVSISLDEQIAFIHRDIEKLKVFAANGKAFAFKEDIAHLRAVLISLYQQQQTIAALQACDVYFKACAKAWEANEGRVVNSVGDPIVQAEGLDELANTAGELVGKVLSTISYDKDEDPK